MTWTHDLGRSTMRRLAVIALSGALVSGCGSGAETHAVSGPVGIGTSSVEVAAFEPLEASDNGIGGVVAGLIPHVDPAAPAAAGFGHPVYTQAEIDRWSTGSAEYTRLANSWAGNVN